MKLRVLSTAAFAVVCLALLFQLSAHANDIGGNYVTAASDSVVMSLNTAPDGAVSGTLSESGMNLNISGKRHGAGFAGMIGTPEEMFPYTATLQGNQIILDIGAGEETERIIFTRAGGLPRTPIAPAGNLIKDVPLQPAALPNSRNVVVNEQRLTEAEISRIEQTYQVRIGDANYWYDKTLGAWGFKGGPASGFIAPGLNIGGPLQPDSSGGETQVFVNGRELHPYDVLALQRITGPILPGHYFITSQGLAGYEGGPPMWNLAAMAPKTPTGSNGSNTWQSRITGASGFSDGTTGAVFLPNGGIVSTGQ